MAQAALFDETAHRFDDRCLVGGDQVSASQAMPKRAINPTRPEAHRALGDNLVDGHTYVITISVAATPITTWMTMAVLIGTSSPASSGRRRTQLLEHPQDDDHRDAGEKDHRAAFGLGR